MYWAKRAFVHAPNLANSYYHIALPLTWLDNDASERLLQAQSDSSLKRTLDAAG